MPATCYFYASSDNFGQTATANLIPLIGQQMTIAPGADPDPEAAGEAKGIEVLAAAAGSRWIFPNKLLQALQGGEIVGAQSVEAFAANGYDFQHHRSRMTLFYTGMRRKIVEGGEVTIEGMVLDEEPGYGGDLFGMETLGVSWAARATVAYEILQHPQLGKRFPAELRAASQAELAAFTNWDSAHARLVSMWDEVTRQEFVRAVRAVAVETFADVFGYLPAVVLNYDDNNTNRMYNYLNGGQIYPGQRTVAGTSSPSMYIQGDAFAQEYTPGKPNWWNRMIYNLNIRRSIVGPCVPHISSPGWDGNSNPLVTNYGIWDEQLYHMAAMGDSRFAGWVSGWTVGDKAHMQAVMEALSPATSVPNRYDPIAYNADSITTNGYTTTYDAALGLGRVTS